MCFCLFGTAARGCRSRAAWIVPRSHKDDIYACSQRAVPSQNEGDPEKRVEFCNMLLGEARKWWEDNKSWICPNGSEAHEPYGEDEVFVRNTVWYDAHKFKSRRTYVAARVRAEQRRRHVHRKKKGAKDCAPQSGLCPKLTRKGGYKFKLGTRGSKWMLVAIADGQVTTARCFHSWNKGRAQQMSKLIRDDLKRLYPDKPIGDWWVVRDGDPSQKCQGNIDVEKKLGMKVPPPPPPSWQKPPLKKADRDRACALLLK